MKTLPKVFNIDGIQLVVIFPKDHESTGRVMARITTQRREVYTLDNVLYGNQMPENAPEHVKKEFLLGIDQAFPATKAGEVAAAAWFSKKFNENRGKLERQREDARHTTYVKNFEKREHRKSLKGGL